MAIVSAPRHSAIVEIELTVSGHVFKASHLSHSEIRVIDPIDLPAVAGEIRLCIDGIDRRWSIYLPEGMSSLTPTTAIRPI